MGDQHAFDTDRKSAGARRLDAGDAPSSADHEPPHALLRLQGQVGNAQVARLLAQRAEGGEEEEEQGEAVQRKPEVGAAGGPLTDDTADRIRAQLGGGAPLDSTTQERMEQTFGTSFDAVRVHSDPESHALNRAVSARAFTTGNDVFLGPHSSSSDSRLLAHELTHVVQQRRMGGAGEMHVGAAGDAHEQHADQVANAFTAQRASEEEEEAG